MSSWTQGKPTHTNPIMPAGRNPARDFTRGLMVGVALSVFMFVVAGTAGFVVYRLLERHLLG